MMTKSILVQLPDGTTFPCNVSFALVPPWKIDVTGLHLPASEFIGEDLFNALIAFRLEIERMGARLLCAGSRRDVFPSGMSREMGGGRKAYITHIGERGRPENLIDIFDGAEADLVSTVEEQKTFHEKWVQSIR